jgi:hypothetical protein
MTWAGQSPGWCGAAEGLFFTGSPLVMHVVLLLALVVVEWWETDESEMEVRKTKIKRERWVNPNLHQHTAAAGPSCLAAPPAAAARLSSPTESAATPQARPPPPPHLRHLRPSPAAPPTREDSKSGRNLPVETSEARYPGTSWIKGGKKEEEQGEEETATGIGGRGGGGIGGGAREGLEESAVARGWVAGG